MGIDLRQGNEEEREKVPFQNTNRTKEQRVQFQEEITVIFSPGKGEMWVKAILLFRALESIIVERAPGK